MARRGRVGGRVRASMVWLQVFAFASGAGEGAAPSRRFGFRRIQPEGSGARHGGRGAGDMDGVRLALDRAHRRRRRMVRANRQRRSNTRSAVCTTLW